MEASAITKRPEQQAQLVRQLVRLSSKEAIAQALGIQDLDSQTEEFWRIQSFTAQSRFFSYCREQLGLDLAKEVAECDEHECQVLAEKARILADQGLNYSQVRTWFLGKGRLAHKLAYQRRHEQERIQGMTLRVLFVLEPKGARWLKASPDGLSFELTDQLEDALHIPVLSVSQMDRDYLAERSKDYVPLLAQFQAKEAKVLCGQRPV